MACNRDIFTFLPIQEGEAVSIVAYRPVAERRLCGRRQFNIRRTGVCNPFLRKVSVNRPTTGVLLGTVFPVWSMRSSYKEKSDENRQSNSGVPNEQLMES
jgi:hypothetical protein